MMYEVRRTNFLYLFIFACLASAFGWVVVSYYKPIIIQANCADIASKSSSIYKDRSLIDPTFEFNAVKDKCVQEAS